MHFIHHIDFKDGVLVASRAELTEDPVTGALRVTPAEPLLISLRGDGPSPPLLGRPAGGASRIVIDPSLNAPAASQASQPPPPPVKPPEPEEEIPAGGVSDTTIQSLIGELDGASGVTIDDALASVGYKGPFDTSVIIKQLYEYGLILCRKCSTWRDASEMRGRNCVGCVSE